MKINEHIKAKHIYISLIVFALGVLVAVLPDKKHKNELPPDKLVLKLTGDSRFITAEQLAQAIIDKDIKYQIIDVRTPEAYAKYSLPGAINIPLDNLLNKTKSGDYEWEAYLNPDVSANVLYSNGEIHANQFWVLCQRFGYTNNYVLKGGLNNWFDIFMNPKSLSPNASDDEKANYEFRNGVRSYFGGGQQTSSTQTNTPTKPIKSKKKKQVEGGC